MHLDDACQWLGWPSADSIRHPANAGAVVLVDLARAKIAEPLRRYSPRLSVETTVLAIDADSPQPLAIVCEFASGTTPEVLREAQRLAWNFSKTGLLITLEPHRLIAWSCLRSPDVSEDELRLCELKTDVAATPERGCQHSVRELLHWVSLITGEYVRKKPNFFRSDERADQLLLKNLRHIRRTLIQAGLPRDYCHDLLARVIFTQFLFHRKDSRGAAFFSETVLAQRCGGALRRVHSDLASILSDKSETYRLFEWLDTHFNGDLFPGKSDQSENEQASAWQAERDAVTPEHLQMLAELVSGTIDTQDRQLLLWPRYSFDTIPLEFISCVYEEFLNEDRDVNKAYYTPPFLVDYVLDAVLPWQGDRWNLRVLDPACGSGIFLVKAFQRIIHRWRQAHGGRPPLVRDLKPILANNFVGVDINPDAVRVACFSLYLAMVDAVEPRHYVSRDKVFPRLRGERLIAGDFFNEAIAVASAGNGTPAYDLVIGNAPWGEDSVLKTSDPAPAESAPTEKRRKNPGDLTHAQRWGGRQGWPIVNLDIGPLFIAKSLQLVTEEGQVAMLQPAPPWLYSRSEPAVQLRHKLF
ncbi:MAG: N-6 DNA methylase, partial [Planctomycetota bacterium]|nr:N-6 DNA methylase [Planctomycetota bacterium]